MEDIDTESPIQSPSNGTIIEIDGKDYEVKSKKISFVTEGDVVFYTTIVTLSNSSRMKNTSTDELDRIKKIMESYGKYQKKISKYDSNGDFFSI
jgi:alpha-acetolactate decarboxylase